MSKKKNTLKDLDDFLKQQAATIVPPAALSDKVEAEPARVNELATGPEEDVTVEKIVDALSVLSQKEGTAFRGKLYDIIIKSLESKSSTPEDKMLINTALYLKSGDNWKEVIKEYWRGKW